MVARQQNRIVDLTLQNNVLVSQIELLRTEVQEMKVHNGCDGSRRGRGNGSGVDGSSAHHRSGSQSADKPLLSGFTPRANDCQRVHRHGADRLLSQDEVRELGAGVTGRTPRQGHRRRGSFDPDGWRRIVGVRKEQRQGQGQDVDVDMDVDVDNGFERDAELGNDDKRKTWMTCDS